MSGKTRKKVKRPEPSGGLERNIHDSIAESVRKLLAMHGQEIRDVRMESEQQIVSVGFTAVIDGSESETTVKTKIRFVQAVTDSLTVRMDDPHQGKFEFVDDRTKEANDEQREARKVEAAAKKAKKPDGGKKGKAKKGDIIPDGDGLDEEKPRIIQETVSSD